MNEMRLPMMYDCLDGMDNVFQVDNEVHREVVEVFDWDECVLLLGECCCRCRCVVDRFCMFDNLSVEQVEFVR